MDALGDGFRQLCMRHLLNSVWQQLSDLRAFVILILLLSRGSLLACCSPTRKVYLFFNSVDLEARLPDFQRQPIEAEADCKTARPNDPEQLGCIQMHARFTVEA